MSIISTKKLVVYLDQNFVSNIAAIGEKDRLPKEYHQLFDLLKEGLKTEKIICPESWFHKEESSLYPDRERAIRDHLRYLGQVDFLHIGEIKANQFFLAVDSFFNKQNDKNKSWRMAFDHDPDKIIERFHIEANLNMQIFNISQSRKQISSGWNEIRKNILQNKTTFHEQQIDEEKVAIRYLFNEYGEYFLRQVDVNSNVEEKIREAIESDYMKNIPHVYISSRMYASLLVHHNHRPIVESDATDIGVISHFLPYCDILATDKFIKAITTNLKIDTKYQCKLFSAQVEDIEQFISVIKSELDKRQPTNVPIFTIIVLPDEKIKLNLWSFYQRLNNLKAIFKNYKDKWVAIINVNDGEDPRYFHREGNFEMPHPSFFFGFDGEINIKSKKDNIRNLYFEHSLSPNIIIIDKFADLEDNFLESAETAIKEGLNKVPKYNFRIDKIV